MTTWPSSDWRIRRVSPAPWQSGQVTGWVPGLAPEPPQTSQVTGRRTEISLSAPNTASTKLSRRPISASEPGIGPRRPPLDPIEPKNASKMSLSPASKSKVIPPGPWPNTPSGPKRS